MAETFDAPAAPRAPVTPNVITPSRVEATPIVIPQIGGVAIPTGPQHDWPFFMVCKFPDGSAQLISIVGNVRTKQEPEIMLEACQSVGIEPKDALYWGKSPDYFGAKHMARSAELRDWRDKLNGGTSQPQTMLNTEQYRQAMAQVLKAQQANAAAVAGGMDWSAPGTDAGPEPA